MTPITLSDPHKGVLPHAYVILIRSQRCLCCHSVHRWSETYAKTHLKAQMGMGKYVTNLRPLDRPQYNLPIHRIVKEQVTVPFCHACNEPSLVGLPPLPIPEEIVNTLQDNVTITKPSPKPKAPTSVAALADFLR